MRHDGSIRKNVYLSSLISLLVVPHVFAADLPKLYINDVQVIEGDSSNKRAYFDIKLSEKLTSTLTFTVATVSDPNATATAGTDYTAVSTSKTITAGSKSTSIYVDVKGDATNEISETFYVQVSNIAGATVEVLRDGKAQGGICNDDDPQYKNATATIGALQGSGNASPYNCHTVTTTNNVVTMVTSNAFYMQSQTPDGNVNTSDAMYVYMGSTPTVAMGNLVNVSGSILEYQTYANEIDGIKYPPVTEITNPTSVTVIASGQTLPAPVQFTSTYPSTDATQPTCGAISGATVPETNFECFESMLVHVANGMINGSTWDYWYNDLYANATGVRSFREKGIAYPGISPYAVWDSTPELFKVSVGEVGLDATTLYGGTLFSATGVLADSYRSDVYTLIPSQFDKTISALPVAVKDAESTQITVGSLNTYLFYDNEDDAAYTTATQCKKTDGTTATIAAETVDDDIGDILSDSEFDTKLAKLSKYVREVLKAPAVLALQELEAFPTGNVRAVEQLAYRIATDSNDLVLYSFVEGIGSDVSGRNVGYLYRSDLLANVKITEFATDECFDYNSGDGEYIETELLHDHYPLMLEAAWKATNLSFAVLTIHNKSLVGVDYIANDPNAENDDDGNNTTYSDDRNRAKRLQQALSIASVVKQYIKANPTKPLAVVGDYNAFQFTDGYIDVLGTIAGTAVKSENMLWQQPATCVRNCTSSNPTGLLTDAVTLIDADQRYSYVYDGNFQVLDHALMNAVAKRRFVDLQYGRGNADVVGDEYAGDATTAIGVSDHDGFVLYLNTQR